MGAARGESPERLLDKGATDFERRLLDAAAKDGPSHEQVLRMAKALGVSAVGAAAATGVAAGNLSAGAAKAAVATGKAAAWPWIVGGVIGLSVIGALVVGGRRRASLPDVHPGAHLEAPAMAPPPSGNAPSSPAPTVRPSPVDTVIDRIPERTSSKRPSLANVSVRDLHGEIQILDVARAAIAERAGRQALALVHRYEEVYPAGTFLPEASAIEVEALMQLGREDEARRLAKHFVAEHEGSLLSDRVAAIAGLPAR
jgi:hypothetical protein